MAPTKLVEAIPTSASRENWEFLAAPIIDAKWFTSPPRFPSFPRLNLTLQVQTEWQNWNEVEN